jgi:predicted lipoprotein with Yx(FWY)xxD motif
MKNKLMLSMAGAALASLVVSGCGGSDSPEAKTPAAGLDAATGSSSLGTIVVNGDGMTAYFYDDDVANSGKSACTDEECTAEWSPIGSASATPKVDGITGKVGTITATDGTMQITIDGRPIYTYADDEAPGDTEGQGEEGEWHVISPAGKEITKDAPAADSGGGY